ncbi:unnamed protein product [Symbiodinium natans]|uniref:Pentatricopeptide repeat-containing protein, chloroplastic n=1 Tax=Symbiodinium natans TaxID=878477 RepID=A0A812J9S9_9DINO|nr:unnamed protein product [Symbiodinium natans]
MDTARLMPNLYGYNSAIVACAQHTTWSLALDILNQLVPQKVLPDVVSYSSFISSCSAVRHWKDALRTMEVMTQAFVAPNRFSYSGVMRCCEGARTWQFALYFLWAMTGSALDPDVVCFTSAIKACEKAEQWSTALGLMEHMLDRAISPNEFTCSSLVSACEKASQRHSAVSVYEVMVAKFVNADLVACSATITSCARITDWPLALALFSEMAEKDIKPNEYTYSGAADACEKGCKWKLMPELLEMLGHRSGLHIGPLGASARLAKPLQSGRWKGHKRGQSGDMKTINVRHVISSVKLRTMEVVYPNNWCARDFRAGAAEAYKQVNCLLDQGDFVSLRRVMADDLVEDLRKTHAQLSKGLDYELKEVFQLGIFHAMVKAEEFGTESVCVTPLLRVTEKYTLQKDPSVWWEVRRLHKWTFKRHLPDEHGNEASDWHIVAMDKRRWRMIRDCEDGRQFSASPTAHLKIRSAKHVAKNSTRNPQRRKIVQALTPDALNVQLLFMMLCCGVGLAAGVDSCRSNGQETLLPQDTVRGAIRLKEDLGVTYDERALMRDHVTEMKYVGFLFFAFRLAVNIKALWRNMMVVCVEDLPLTVGSAARVLEAGIFLEHLCKLPCEILSCMCGIHASPSQCVGTVKTLAGFSAMRFVRFLNKRHIFGALRKIAADPNIFKGCYLVLIGVLYSLVLAGFGLSVLLTKLRGLDIQAMESAGVLGLFQAAWAALTSHGLSAFMATDLMELVEFTNQVASAMNIKEEEMHSLLSFLLGDKDHHRAQAYMDTVMSNFLKLPRWSSRLVAMITFDAEGLQRLVRERNIP